MFVVVLVVAIVVDEEGGGGGGDDVAVGLEPSAAASPVGAVAAAVDDIGDVVVDDGGEPPSAVAELEDGPEGGVNDPGINGPGAGRRLDDGLSGDTTAVVALTGAEVAAGASADELDRNAAAADSAVRSRSAVVEGGGDAVSTQWSRPRPRAPSGMATTAPAQPHNATAHNMNRRSTRRPPAALDPTRSMVALSERAWAGL